MFTHTTKNTLFVLSVCFPAIVAWTAYGLCWVLDPYILGNQVPIKWAMYTVCAYYIILGLSWWVFITDDPRYTVTGDE